MVDSIRTAEDIEVADQVELRVADPETGEIQRYKSSVQDFADEGIAVTMPQMDRLPVPLPEGTSVIVAVWKGYADYLFKSRVLKRVGGHLPQLVLSRPAPEDIKRTPRRQVFRADTKIPVKIEAFDEEDQPFSLSALMMDLSGGGCRLQTSRHLPVDASVRLDFALPFPPDKDSLDCTKPLRKIPGKVRSALVPPDPKKKPPIHTLGIEFDRLDNVVYNTLLRYVAFRQRELLSQLKDPSPGDQARAPSHEDVEEIEENLKKLERELGEAGQEIPEVEPATTPAGAESGESTLCTTAEASSGEAPPAVLAPPPSSGPTPAQVVAPPASTGEASGQRILLVEDEDALRSLLAEALQQEGYSVMQAPDGQKALELALNVKVNLVITDLMMPKMNGWSLLASLREHNIDVPVLVITGYMAQEGPDVLTNKDIAGFLVKPIDLEEMTKAVRHILSSKSPDRKYRILAVDDDEEMRLLISACLEKAGFEVKTAKDGWEALNKLRFLKPDLVLLDIMMPRTGGFSVCRKLRSDPATASLPVIMLTSKTSSEYVNLAIAQKINGYIVKPFDPATLVARISNVLQSVASK